MNAALLAIALLSGPPPAPTLKLDIIVDGNFASNVLQAEFERQWDLSKLSGEVRIFYDVQFIQAWDTTGVRGPFPVAIVNRAERKHIGATGSGLALMELREFTANWREKFTAVTVETESEQWKQENVWRKQWRVEHELRHPTEDDGAVEAAFPW